MKLVMVLLLLVPSLGQESSYQRKLKNRNSPKISLDNEVLADSNKSYCTSLGLASRVPAKPTAWIWCGFGSSVFKVQNSGISPICTEHMVRSHAVFPGNTRPTAKTLHIKTEEPQ